MKTLSIRSAVLAILMAAAGGARAHTLPDLTVTALSGAPTSIGAGQSFSLTSTVKATGAAVTRSFVVSFYLSTDANITTADTLIGSRTVSSLALNATSTATTTVTVPAGQGARSYYVGAIVDSANVVSESSETNNTRAGTQIQVTGAGIDLTVTSLSGAPASIGAGASFTVTSTVAASGSGSAGAFTVSFYLSTDATITSADTLIGSRTVSSLAAGASSTATTSVTVPASLAVGTYTVGAIVDSGSTVAETNETNNARAGSQVAVVKPDLSMTGLSGVPSTIGLGDTITVTDTVALASGGGAVGTFSVGYYLATTSPVTTSGVFVGSRTVSGLPAGQSSSASTALVIPASLATGTWYLGAIADMSGVITESNESNNTATSAPMVVGAFSCQRPASPIDDGNPCTTDACDPVRGVTHDPVAAGTSCSDGNYCNGFETCDGAGTCLSGLAPQIDDGNPCTADSCDPATGVWHTPLATGTSCSDGNVCNGVEACNGAGTCQAGTPLVTDDHDPCTADSCDPVLGVRHTWIASCTVVPPDPTTLAPPNDPTVATDIAASTAFLYSGANPIQYGVAPGTIEARRVVILRGSVRDRDGAPLPGARVTVLNHPEFGWTASRADGAFDIAVNGGGGVTLNYQKDGFLVSQRQVTTPWRDFVTVPEVVLVPFDSRVTTVAMGAGTPQVARGSATSDEAGARQATLVFPPGTQATMRLADGSVQTLPGAINVRATEYTVGEAGPKSMPGELPPTSGYTYAVELSVDEAVVAGATTVQFNQPVAFYVENFLGFPVGEIVPVGYYDRAQGAWVPSQNGRVVKIVGATNGLADLDTDGDGTADDAAKLLALGVTDAERFQLLTYPLGVSLWRAPVTHFTPYDCNYPYGCDGTDCTPPKEPPPTPPVPQPDPCITSGSVIECENQVLGEVVPITGTPYSLHYRSSRVPGRKASRSFEIRLTATPPAAAIGVAVEILVAGRLFSERLPRTPNALYSFTWDGLDAYGRPVVGRVKAEVKIGYVYRQVYLQPSARTSLSFGSPSYSGVPISVGGGTGGVGPPPATLWQRFQVELESLDQRGVGLGGWSISPHHHGYSPEGGALYLGDGSTLAEQALGAVIDHYAGGPLGDGDAMVAGPDGSLYFGSWKGYVTRITPDGVQRLYAGQASGSRAEGIPATAALIGTVHDLAVSPDGGLFIAERLLSPYVPGQVSYWLNRIRKVDRNGYIRTFAGEGPEGFSGDGGPATAARIDWLDSIAAAPDGSLYILAGARLRRVDPSGIISTVAGDGVAGCNDGRVENVRVGAGRIRVDAQGRLYLAGGGSCLNVRRFDPDGVVRTIAGTGTWGFGGDGGPATEALLSSPKDVAVASDGTVFVLDWGNNRLRAVTSAGQMVTIAGGGTDRSHYLGKPGPWTLNAELFGPYALALGPNGDQFILNFGGPILRIASALPGLSLAEYSIAKRDGDEVFIFSPAGRHLRTVDARTGVTRRTFQYDASGRVQSITEAGGDITVVERDAFGRMTGIVAPHGQRTAVTLDANGYLERVEHPGGAVESFVSSADGLLRSLTDGRGHVHTFVFDDAGLLTNDTGPSGSFKTLARTANATSYSVAVETSLGRRTRYQVGAPSSGGAQQRATFLPDGTTSTSDVAYGQTTTTGPDGTVRAITYSPDPRFGMQSPVASMTVTTPDGLRRVIAESRSANTGSPPNVLSPSSLVDTVTDNGRVWASSWDAGTRKVTRTTPAGRKAMTTLDAKGRVERVELPGGLPTAFSYDASDRVEWVTQGSRVSHVEYDAAGYPWRLTDPQGRQVTMEYDLAGRPWRQTLPGGRQVTFGPDPNGNLTSLTPPGRPPHGFTYWPGDALKSYDPPAASVGGPLWPTGYSYDLDGALAGVALPDGTSVVPAYEPATGRLSSVTTAHGMAEVGYDPQGRLWTLSTPDGVLTYGYDGFLVTSESSTGAVPGAVSWTYDNDFRPATQTVNGSTVSYGYDSDGVLTAAGALTLTPEPATGRLASTAMGSVTTTQTYTNYGEPWVTTASVGGTAVYSYTLERSALSPRIEGKTETIGGVTTHFTYGYDDAGRLATVTRDGTLLATYGYDDNGNRTSRTTAQGTEVGVPDLQDRLVSNGATTYTYRPTGAVESRTDALGTSWYDYDALGNLRAALLPSGTRIDYVVDGLGRRVGKKVNGQFVEGFLYEGKLRPVAWLDGAGQVKARFVYGTKVNVPEYMVTTSGTYRILTDHLGSPRLVVDATTGAIAQRMDYDEWGQVLLDTNPGFQPFGFAGGLYDRDTGLVRFGARDYEPATGRWTNKDPIRFQGGDTNLFLYVAGDPLNAIDPSGTFFLPYHGAIAFTASLVSGRGLGESLVNGWSSMAADVWKDSQLVENSAWHSMSKADQTLQQAKDAQRLFIEQRLAEDMPWSLGRAMHANEDADAAAHGFRVWDGNLTLAHVLMDLFPSRDELWRAFLHDWALLERMKDRRCR